MDIVLIGSWMLLATIVIGVATIGLALIVKSTSKTRRKKARKGNR